MHYRVWCMLFYGLLFMPYESESGVHVSVNFTIPCSESEARYSTFRPHVDSYLLSEGESLILNCGVCDQCNNAPPECWKTYDAAQWQIQRTRYLGYGGDLNGELEESPVELYKIRLRLHERIWPERGGLPAWVESVIHSQIDLENDHQLGDYGDLKAAASSFLKDKGRRQNLTRPLVSAPRLYIFVAKPNEAGYVLTAKHGKFSKGRIQLDRDKLIIKQTRFEDTGMYYCYFEGRKVREWAVTVINAMDEPFRYLTRPIEYDASVWDRVQQRVENHTIPEDCAGCTRFPSRMKPLNRKLLLKHNLKLQTEWSGWTDCMPCTPPDQLPRSPEPGGDGFQMRVGLCRVTLLDPFHPVQPHDLALQLDNLMRSHSRRGLPCRSHLIRDAMRLFGPKAVIARPNEIMIRECVRTCLQSSQYSGTARYKAPKRVQIRVNEGESLVISCPVRGAVRAPISWFYAPMDLDELANVTNSALAKDNIEIYGSPSSYLTTVLSPVDVVHLFDVTRGRYRLDPANSLIMAEAIAKPQVPNEARLHHLICVHGDARATRSMGFSDWAGIIEIDVVPRTYAVLVLSKLSQVILLLIPFALALGTFLVIAITLHTERKPNMRAAADGFTNKPPP